MSLTWVSAANIQVSRAAPFPETLRENLGPCSLRLSESSSLRLQDGRPCLAAGCRLASLLPEVAACPGPGPPILRAGGRGSPSLPSAPVRPAPPALRGLCRYTGPPDGAGQPHFYAYHSLKTKGVTIQSKSKIFVALNSCYAVASLACEYSGFIVPSQALTSMIFLPPVATSQ